MVHLAWRTLTADHDLLQNDYQASTRQWSLKHTQLRNWYWERGDPAISHRRLSGVRGNLYVSGVIINKLHWLMKVNALSFTFNTLGRKSNGFNG